MSAGDVEIDAEAFAALLEEEGVSDDVLGVDNDGEDAGEPLVDEVVATPHAATMRFAPPRVSAKGTSSRPSRPRSPASSTGGSVPSYMRGTASRAGTTDRSRSPAASSSRLSTTSSTTSGTSKPSSTVRGGKSPAASGDSGPKIAGKTPYSTLPENAGRAEMVRQVETMITEAVGAGKILMDDVVGLDDAKRALEEAIVFPRLMASMGSPLSFTKGVLLYGPPGTGKTHLARAQATGAGCTFFAVTASSIMSKWLGESEKMVRALFDAARYYAPAIVFIDEVDALTGERGSGGEHEAMLRVKNELLAQLDGMASGSSDPDKMVLALGATNRPWALDEAFRRRFEKRILVPLPDEQVRSMLLRKSMGKFQLSEDVNFDSIVSRTDGYNCADIVQICRDAAVGPLREISQRMKADNVPVTQMIEYVKAKGITVNTVAMRHFDDSLKRIKSSVGGPESQKRLRDWSLEFGST